MRGTRHAFGPSRIKGQAALLRRLRALAIAAHRYGAHRASTDAERRFAYALFDGLKGTLDALEPETAAGNEERPHR